MDPSWRKRLDQWKSYNAWERESLREDPVSFEAALAWMWDAWRLARRLDPEWSASESIDENVTRLARIRTGLAMLSPSR